MAGKASQVDNGRREQTLLMDCLEMCSANSMAPKSAHQEDPGAPPSTGEAFSADIGKCPLSKDDVLADMGIRVC